MKMDGNLRVKADRKYHNLYTDLKIVGDMHEIFFLCVCLGYKTRNPKSLGKSGEDHFHSHTITEEEWACYYAIMVEANSMDFNSIHDDKKVLALMEEYADAGMEILLDELLFQYTNRDSGDLRLDTSSSKELPKIFLSFVHSKLPEVSLR